MKAIFASKLYQSSDRKEEIKSALQNPLNKGLVQQLEEYLDEPVDEPEEDTEKPDDEEKSVKKVDKKSSDDKSKDSSEDRPVRKSGMNISRSPKQSPDGASSEESEPSDEQPSLPEDNSSVEESSCVEESECGRKKKKVRSSIKSSIFYVPSFSVDTLIGTLKSKESTAMVDRVRIKDDKELWIFYNDSVNLNDIMNDVIELINSAGYSHLEFNRLARSDNAIVFEFTPESIPMQPDEESDSDDVEIEGVEIGEKTTE